MVAHFGSCASGLFLRREHRKGLVDALFAIVKGWLWDYMLTPNVELKDDQEVLAALLAGAKIAHARDPGGPEYVVQLVSPGRKPTQMWHQPRTQSGDGVVIPT